MFPSRVDVQLGELPAGASKAMHDVADDIRLLSVYGWRWTTTGRCHMRRGSVRTVAGLHDQGHASRVLRQLVDAGVIMYVESLEPRGKGDGTKLYEAP